MRKRLFEVEYCDYTVSGTLVLSAKVETNSLNFKIGDSIVLVKPNGTEIKTKIDSYGRFKVQNSPVHSILVKTLRREDVPIGTVIFKIE